MLGWGLIFQAEAVEVTGENALELGQAKCDLLLAKGSEARKLATGISGLDCSKESVEFLVISGRGQQLC